MADSQKLFDWQTLIQPGIDIGLKALGSKIAPEADLQAVRNSQQQNQFNNQLQLQRAAQANKIRQQMMPGMFTTLGFSPEQGKQMAADYANTAASTPMGYGGAATNYAPQASKPGLGSKVGGAALGIGASVLPAVLGKVLGGAASAAAPAAAPAAATAGAAGGATAGSTGGILGGLGATGVGAIAAGAIGAGLLAKKLIGQGRKQADKLTGEGGLQYVFNEGLAKIVAAQQAGEINQQERDELVRQMYAQLKQDGARFAAGGENQAKVVRQMLAHYLTNPVTASALAGSY